VFIGAFLRLQKPYGRSSVRASSGALLFSFLLSASSATLADDAAPGKALPKELQGIGITEHLGAQLQPSSFRLKDEAGKDVTLASYFRSGKPVVLTLVYYQCPNLCNFLLNGLTDGLKDLEWTAGEQFELVSVSINPKEGPELAAAKKESYIEAYGRPAAAKGWHFLTGTEAQVRALADQVGFGYRYNPEDGQYAHSAAAFVLTPEGRISRYLYGIQFKPKDLKMALVEASNGRVGTVIDRLLLFCYQYDPKTKRYSLAAFRLLQAGGAGTLLVFGGYMTVFWRRQRRDPEPPQPKTEKGA
jgi:protein SCO1